MDASRRMALRLLAAATLTRPVVAAPPRPGDPGRPLRFILQKSVENAAELLRRMEATFDALVAIGQLPDPELS